MLAADTLRWSLVSTRLGLCICVPTLLIISRIPLAAADSYEGKRIAAIEFEPARQPMAADRLEALLAIHAGQPLHAARVTDAIQRLYATGEYSDIVAHATLTADGGVILKFVTKPAYFIGNVRINGVPEPPNQGQLVVATKLELGREFSADETKLASDRLVDILRRNGFFRVNVQPVTAFDDTTQEVKINFNIDPGKRAKYAGLTAEGTPERPLIDIIKATRWMRPFGWFGWRPVTEARTQSGLDNIRKWYPKHDHLAAKVALRRMNFDPETNLVIPDLAIDSGPEITVRVRGAKISDGKLRSILPIYQERAVDKDLLAEGMLDLAAYFQTPTCPGGLCTVQDILTQTG